MRQSHASIGKARNIFCRILAVALAATSVGLVTQVASALEFVTYDIEDLGNDEWRIVGQVDVNQDTEFGEVAEVTFGGSAAGLSTETDVFGVLEYIFTAPYGSTISFTASTATEQSATISASLGN